MVFLLYFCRKKADDDLSRMTEVASLLPADHRLTSVRHYEAGPPPGLELVSHNGGHNIVHHLLNLHQADCFPHD